jgi:DNA-binding CsgD family transcriptional regulator
MHESRVSQNLDLSLLSPRENDVLEVAVQGLSAREIAGRLSLTEATVRSHLSAAYSKLGVAGRVELLARMNEAAGRDRTEPGVDDEGRGAGSAGRPRRALIGHYTLARLAYMLWFGSVFAEAFYGHTVMIDGRPDTGLIWVWTAMGFAGSVLVAFKNQRIDDRRLRARFWAGDLAVMSAALLLNAGLPGSIGMVKGIVLLGLFGPYAYWYFRTLVSAGLWQPATRAR